MKSEDFRKSDYEIFVSESLNMKSAYGISERVIMKQNFRKDDYEG
jgi:hypothetical protein